MDLGWVVDGSRWTIMKFYHFWFSYFVIHSTSQTSHHVVLSVHCDFYFVWHPRLNIHSPLNIIVNDWKLWISDSFVTFLCLKFTNFHQISNQWNSRWNYQPPHQIWKIWCGWVGCVSKRRRSVKTFRTFGPTNSKYRSIGMLLYNFITIVTPCW